jgi:hypothetical protein
MPSTFPHRFLVVIPAAQQAAVAGFWTANIDPNDSGTTFTVGLSASGNAPATFYWASTALTDAQIIAIVRKLAQMAGITVPTAGSLSTKAAKLAWLANNAAALLSNTGITVVRDDEDSTWTSADSVRTGLSLVPIGGAP